ncbi:MAG: DNA polymerase III subunit alpha [Bacteroidia bacterium]|nr:DNA polymerase III subunit alpha [Bacteroidia bacterium]
MPDFVHLHCHTQYSLLDGAAEIGTMMDKAVADGQLGVALTDHGNMFGAFKFVAEAKKRKIKPIIGCEFYIVEDRHKKSFKKSAGESDKRYHQLLLAKNEQGYRNLSKLCSLGFIEGLYSKWPRIDKELLLQYHEGIIATSCCLGAMVPSFIVQKGEEAAEKELKWWLDVFGEDYYIELQRHQIPKIDDSNMSQEDVNQVLIKFARKHGVKVIATNDSHYVDRDDANAHDILLCVNQGELQTTPIGRGRGYRFGFPVDNTEFFFKTKQEMSSLFSDIPEALDHTMDIFGKIDELSLAQDVLLPAFPIPKEFKSQDDFLRHLSFNGAKRRYGAITPEIEERLNFELMTIQKSGYPGYFLIVQDFTNVAREMGVAVGPGRGSAAGSLVAYCTGITNVDPLKYDLLFERFLNPERISMPDIDIDFDDIGRAKIIDYVIDKYGKNQVAQIITYGSMAAKSSIRDVGRVLDLPLSEVDKVTKMFPQNLSASLNKVLKEGGIDPKLKDKLNGEDLDRAAQFRKLAEQDNLLGETLRTAKSLEGSVRNTGVHACGVIITPDEIMNYVPVTVAKDSDLLLSQFDNSVAEDAGLLKMDFLGLKTLSIINSAVEFIKDTRGIEINIDEIDLEDKSTYELFHRGDTIGIFQYESAGMQKHLKDLKPDKFEDLIAMNALYRPGPMQYIPNFIARRHGKEPISYDLPDMEEYLKETYGITVYQEQVMLLSQKLAGFSKGEADTLRKGMGKKIKAVLDKMYPKFVEGCTKNGHPKEVVDKIWKDWEAFASYAFNKSHSTCYALVAFQTAYLKANYPQEFMAAVLTHNKNDISKVNLFLREAKRLAIDVLGPDVNESKLNFSVNPKGQIRFGLSALKGVGEAPVEEIIRNRKEGGPYTAIIDFMTRSQFASVNRKCIESLAYGGAFDCFGDIHRAQYFGATDKYDTYIDHLIKYANSYHTLKSQSQNSLFGESQTDQLVLPQVPSVPKWSLIKKLTKEKDVAGIYVTGHPLDDYRYEVDNFTTCTLEDLDRYKGQRVKVAGIITSAENRLDRKGVGYGRYTLEDYNGSLEFMMRKEAYRDYRNRLEKGEVVLIEAAYKQSWNDPDRYYFNVEKVRQLAAVSDEMTKSITIRVPIRDVTEEMIAELESLCTKYKGKHVLKMELLDMEAREKLQFNIPSRKINADNDFITHLQAMGLLYHVN